MRAACLIAGFALVAAGCGAARSNHQVRSHPQSLVGGSVTVAIPQRPANLNPLTPAGDNSATRAVMAAVWPAAFTTDPSFSPAVNFDLLSSAELVSVDPQTVVYRINPKAMWSDGVPISAEDFVYDWHAQSGLASYSDVGRKPFAAVSTLGYSDIASVTGSDGGRTVTVVFRKPFADWESLFDPLVPAHIASKVGWDTGFETISSSVEVSGGPFQISSANASEVVLTPNPRWWGQQPALASIRLVAMEDPSSYPAALQSGAIQLVKAPAQVDLAERISYLADVRSWMLAAPRIEQIDFNLRNPLLAQLPVREAIADYTDRNALIAAGPGQLVEYENIPCVDDSHIFAPGSSCNAPLGYYKPNGSYYDAPHPQAASRLLSEDGFVMGKDGYWHLGGPTGPILVVRYSFDDADPIVAAVAQTFQAEMKQAGIQVNLVGETEGQLEADLLAGNFDLAQASVEMSPYPSSLLGLYATSTSAAVSATAGSTAQGASSVPPAQTQQAQPQWPLDHAPAANIFGYDDPVVDALFVKAIANPDAFDAASVYNQIDVALWNDLPSLPLYEDSELVAYSDSLRGITSGGEGPNVSTASLLWNADNWSLVPEETTSTLGPTRRTPTTPPSLQKGPKRKSS
jgi:peptide/nickel transport system substrate-binding protein